MPNRVGANGARIVPGESSASRLYLRVSRASAQMYRDNSGSNDSTPLMAQHGVKTQATSRLRSCAGVKSKLQVQFRMM